LIRFSTHCYSKSKRVFNIAFQKLQEKSRLCRAVIFGENKIDDEAHEMDTDPKINYRELVFYDLCISLVQVYDSKTDRLIVESGDDSTIATLAFRANEEFEFLKVN
jgi:hypothetical protein